MNIGKVWMAYSCVLACLLLQGDSCLGLTNEKRKTIQVYNQTSPGVVIIRSKIVRYGHFFRPLPTEGMGSGVLVGTRGHIVTNAHVIMNARSIEVTLADGSRWSATVLGNLPEQDLAVIRIKASAESLHPIPLGTSKGLKVGQKVLAIGNPFGFGQTLTQGVISSLDKKLMTPEGLKLEGLIQTDAAINLGNSGGPLLDHGGRLIGINTIILSPSGGSVGVGFAIPVDAVR